MRKLLGIIISIIIFSSCEKQNEMFFPPEVGDVTLYGITAKTVYAESYIEDSKNIDVDECGFCVYPNDDKTDVRYVKAVLSNGMFSVKIDSLKPGTDYRIKAYARNAVGIGYSDSEKICKTSLSVAEISTNNVLDITPTTAVCGGNITSDGGLQVTERGVCWSTSHNPTIYNNRTTDGTGIGSFTSSITDLTNETTYYVRAYATNSMGTAYGDEKCFLTTAKPTVMTRLVTDVSDISAVCGGNVTSIGSSPLTARGVCWATHHNPTVDDNKTFDGVDVGEFISNITELTEGTVYHVRAYATNEVGTSYGEEITFRTLTFPTVSTNIVTNVSFTTATCGGNISSDGGAEVTARGVCWSTSQNPTISDNKTIDGEGLGNFTSNITGLTAETTYYVRAYATNSVGIAYGEQRIFTTATTVLPTVTTSAASNIAETSAVCGGNVTWDGGATVTSRGIVYWTSSNNVSQTVICGSGTGNFTTTLSGLSAGTTYYYKAYSTNSVGTSYGEQMSFTTLSTPVVTTRSITNISFTSVVCGGNISHNGGSIVTARGVCWSTSPNPTISDSKTNNGSGTGSFTSNITGLTDGTTYYIRAYATNSVGTAYGQELQFMTVDYGTPGQPFTDIRDGNTYSTVIIGSQTWMAENLRYAGNIQLGDTTSYNTAYRYYPNNNSNNVHTYGYLYNRRAVFNGASSSSSNPSGIQGICPDGWHLPSNAEWSQLSDYLNNADNVGAMLAGNTNLWESGTLTNSSYFGLTGFSALPAGVYSNYYSGFGRYAKFWSATEMSFYSVYIRFISYERTNISGWESTNYASSKDGFSVRCVKNE